MCAHYWQSVWSLCWYSTLRFRIISVEFRFSAPISWNFIFSCFCFISHPCENVVTVVTHIKAKFCAAIQLSGRISSKTHTHHNGTAHTSCVFIKREFCCTYEVEHCKRIKTEKKPSTCTQNPVESDAAGMILTSFAQYFGNMLDKECRCVKPYPLHWTLRTSWRW